MKQNPNKRLAATTAITGVIVLFLLFLLLLSFLPQRLSARDEVYSHLEKTAIPAIEARIGDTKCEAPRRLFVELIQFKTYRSVLVCRGATTHLATIDITRFSENEILWSVQQIQEASPVAAPER